MERSSGKPMMKRIVISTLVLLLLAGSALGQGVIGGGILGGGGGHPSRFKPVAWWDANVAYTDAAIISPSTYGVEKLGNVDFETVTDDNFGTWTEEITGTGNIEDETTILHGGSHSAKLTAGSGVTDVYQAVSVTSGSTYHIELWTRGDGTNAGRFGVYHNSGYVVPVTTASNGTAWRKWSADFTATATATATLSLYAPATTGIAYYDDISIKVISPAAVLAGGCEAWTVPSAAQKVVNGTFDDATSWTKTAEVGIADGVATFTAAGSTALYQNCSAEANSAYLVQFDLVATSGTMTAVFGGTGNGSASFTTTGAKSVYVNTGANANGNVVFAGSPAFTGTIDNVAVVQVPSDATTWAESVSGASFVYREDTATNINAGSHSAALQVGPLGLKTAIQQTVLTSGAGYDYTIYLKAASGTPVVKVGTATTNNSHTITTSYVGYSGSFTADATTLEISCATANSIAYVDTITVSGRTAATNGSDIVYVTDRSGTGNHATIVPLAQRPVLVTNQINILPILDFDGVDDRLNTTLAGLGAATIFVVGKTTTAGDVMFGVDESNDRSYISAVAGPLIGGGVATHTDATIVSDVSPASAYRVICLTYGGNATAETLYVGGTQKYTGTQSGDVSTTKTYAIGGLNNNGTVQDFAEAEIAAIVVYNRVLSVNERNAVTAWLNRIYGL